MICLRPHVYKLLQNNSTVKKNIVILATKEAHALGDLLIRNFSGDLNANILAVIANHNTLGDLVTKFGIPFHCVPHENVARDEHERLVLYTIFLSFTLVDFNIFTVKFPYYLIIFRNIYVFSCYSFVLLFAQVMAQIDQYNPEFIVLAKYMRILSPTFVDAYTERIINIHHSFLPAFIGANPYKYVLCVCVLLFVCIQSVD